MSVYEHQSSYNPNMPLRMMEYTLNLYTGYLARSNLKIHTLEDAVDMAIQKMPDTYRLKPFLVAQKMEVCGMLDTEYNEDEIRELFMEDGRREERQKTEAAEKRANEEKMRADAAEADLAKYKDKFGALN